MRTPLVAGNWKLNGTHQSALALAEAVAQGRPEGVDVAIFPSFVHLAGVGAHIQALQSSVQLGAQSVSAHEQGAFTGEVSALMLSDLGLQMALVGHSERRELFGEDDAQCLAKVQALLAQGLTPVLCVGETLAQREAEQTKQVVSSQVAGVFDSLGTADALRCVIAYEPVWAIGTGLSASAEQAQAVHADIRAQLKAFDVALAEGVRILYGGSVKPANAESLFSQADIDGGLIGGASLNADDFLAICQAATAR